MSLGLGGEMGIKFLGVYPARRAGGIAYRDLYPPLGLECVAAAAKDVAEKVTIVDTRYEKEPVEGWLRDFDVLGLSLTWPAQLEVARELLERVPPGPGAHPVILGGLYASLNPDDCLRDFSRADALVRGDGEDAIREILAGRPFSGIPGLSFRVDGRVVHNTARAPGIVPDVAPDRGLRKYAYRARLPGGFKIGLDCVMSSRGCPYQCEFCTFNLDESGRRRPWSGRPAESVAAEVAALRSDIVIFTDDNFGHDMDRVGRICDLLAERGVRKAYGCEMRLEAARRPDVLARMARAGFAGISLGLESCRDATLRRMGKGFTIRGIERAFQTFRKFPFFYLGYFILGYVGETPADMMEIPRFAKRLGLDFIGVSLLRGFRDSPLSRALADGPGYRIDADGFVVSDALSHRDLERIQSRVLRRFYTPLQIFRILAKLVTRTVPKAAVFRFLAGLVACSFFGRHAKRPLGRLG